MKTLLLYIAFIFGVNTTFSQTEKSYTISDFISNECASDFESVVTPFTDSTTGIWQVAFPTKAVINQAFQDQFAVITDSVNHYPSNDSSSFIISLIDEGGFGDNVYGFPHTAYISGYYWVNSDSLQDYGKIELKMPRMDFWIDLFADSIYSYYEFIKYPAEDMITWYPMKPVLSGNTNGWNYFKLNLIPLSQHYEVLTGDTLQFRFSFHSDSIPDTLDGLAFDELVFCDYVESLEEYAFVQSTVFPNPTSSELNIVFQQEALEKFDYVIENSLGEILLFGPLIDNKIDVSTLKTGVYFLRTTNGKKLSINRFVKT